MEQVHQDLPPFRVVGGPLLATAVVDVLIVVLVEAPPLRCWPWVVVVWKGVVRPVVPVPGRRVWRSVTTLPGGDCSSMCAPLWHLMGL